MDYIYIINENNEKEKMEVVTIYNIPNSSYNYIIYKSLESTDYYIAKYTKDDSSNLITDLTDEEITYGNNLMNRIGESI